MIDTTALRINILNLATSGRLTDFRDTDSSVEDIIKELPEPTNKRKKLLQQKFEYDQAFEIPSHWKWVKLGEICSYGDTPTKVMLSECNDDTWVLELEDIQAGGKLLRKKRAKERKSIGEKTKFKEGQLLYSKLRPYLKKVLVADESGISTPELIASDVFEGVSSQYLVYCLTNSYVDNVINKRSYGIKMPRVDAGFMVNLPIPLPPLEEQERIVNIVEGTIQEIEKIDILQRAYANNVQILKSKIIDAGIQGKLTDQLPEDGTAEELYADIQKEKELLIKEGKIKKEKSTYEIRDEDIPYAIPCNWKWMRVEELAYLTSGKPYEETERGELYIKVSDMNIPGNEISITTSEHFVSASNIGCIPKYSIIFPKRGGAIATNKKRIVIDREIFVDLNTMGMTVIKPEMFPYVKIWFDSLNLDELQTGTSIPQINNKDIYPLMIPVPPLMEQKRIVNKIEELLSII